MNLWPWHRATVWVTKMDLTIFSLCERIHVFFHTLYYSSQVYFLPHWRDLVARPGYYHCSMLCHTSVPLCSCHHLLQSHKKVRLQMLLMCLEQCNPTKADPRLGLVFFKCILRAKCRLRYSMVNVCFYWKINLCTVCVKDEVQFTAMGLRRGKVRNGTKSQCLG